MALNILNMQGLSTEKVITDQGGLGVAYQHDKLQQDIRTLLLTRQGSVIGNPLYGSTLHTYIFDQESDSSIASLKREITDILRENYNFINEVSIDATIDKTSLNLKISYTTTVDNLTSSLQFTIPLDDNGMILST